MNACDVVATTGSPAFAVDRHGKILAWNNAAQESLGYRRKEVLGRRCYGTLRGRDFFGNRYCGESCPLRERALLGGPINPTQMSFRTANGEEQPVMLSILVVPGEGSIDKAMVHLLQCLPPGSETVAGRPPARAGGADNGNARLTPREMEVLARLGDGKGDTGDRGDPLHQLLDGPSPRAEHLQQAQGPQPTAGGRPGPQARTGLTLQPAPRLVAVPPRRHQSADWSFWPT